MKRYDDDDGDGTKTVDVAAIRDSVRGSWRFS